MQLETNMFMQVTRMFYELAIEDFTRLFRGASEQGNKETVVFQTGLTGLTGFAALLAKILLILDWGIDEIDC